MKTTFLFKFGFLITLSQITSFQVNKDKLLIDSFSLFPCLCVSMMFESLIEKKFKSKGGFIVLIYTPTTVVKYKTNLGVASFAILQFGWGRLDLDTGYSRFMYNQFCDVTGRVFSSINK